MYFRLTIFTFALCALLVARFAFAHHSFAPYDIRNPIEISGVVEDFVFIRPHPMLTFLDQENVEWEIEVPLRFWNRAGLAPDAIKPGDELMVRGWPSRRGIPEMALSGFELDGTYYAVLEEVRQRSAVAAAEAIESGESVESVLEEYSERTTLPTPNETVTGEELFVVCANCHGDSGQGNDRRDGPALAGLEPWYLELQMQNFKNGIRGYLAEDVPGQVMHFTKGMLRNDFTISSLAEYISALEPGQPQAANATGARPYVWISPYAGIDPSVVGNAEQGRETYSTVCTACHGADGTGDEALGAANLNYLSELYMTRQLMYFRDGIRGAHAEDTRGQQMAVMAKLLTDDQSIADVVAYISEL